MHVLDPCSMCLAWSDQAGGKQGDPSFYPYAIPRDDRLLGKLEGFHASPQTCHQSQARAIEPFGQSLMGS
jgi:hypothetical protein